MSLTKGSVSAREFLNDLPEEEFLVSSLGLNTVKSGDLFTATGFVDQQHHQAKQESFQFTPHMQSYTNLPSLINPEKSKFKNQRSKNFKIVKDWQKTKNI